MKIKTNLGIEVLLIVGVQRSRRPKGIVIPSAVEESLFALPFNCSRWPIGVAFRAKKASRFAGRLCRG
jgi:hypothetical protein